MSGRGRHPGDQLAALVDGRLGEPDRSRVVSHLTTCTECLAEYDSQLALKGVLGGLSTPAAPEALRSRLAEVLAATPVDPAVQSALHRVGRGTKVSAAAMVLAAATLGGGYLAGGSPAGEAVVPPVDQYVREHAAVSVGVPLTAPVLYQLVPAPTTLVVSTVAVPVATAEPAPARPISALVRR